MKKEGSAMRITLSILAILALLGLTAFAFQVTWYYGLIATVATIYLGYQLFKFVKSDKVLKQ